MASRARARALPSLPPEVAVGPRQGLAAPSVVNVDLVQTVAKGRMADLIGELDEGQLRQVCVALGLALGCLGG